MKNVITGKARVENIKAMLSLSACINVYRGQISSNSIQVDILTWGAPYFMVIHYQDHNITDVDFMIRLNKKSLKTSGQISVDFLFFNLCYLPIICISLYFVFQRTGSRVVQRQRSRYW